MLAAIPQRVIRCSIHLLALVLFLTVAPAASSAQTAVPPAAGDGLSTASAFQITELGNLVWLQQEADSGLTSGTYYALANDIDASVTATWNDAATTTATLEGFLPIGTSSSPFCGVLEGNRHKIAGLTLNRPGTDGVGLFGCIGQNSAVRYLALEGGAVTGRDFAGGAIGYCDRGIVANVSATGAVAGRSYVGGLAGGTHLGTVQGCYATGAVRGSLSEVGGLVGYNYCAMIAGSYATGAATGLSSMVGGLIGDTVSGTVSDCYATGAATGSTNVGGLIGVNEQSTVTTCYSVGAVTGSDAGVGGLIASNLFGAVMACYWDAQSSGQAASGGGTGETTAQMRQQGTFVPAGVLPGQWDFTAVWGILGTYPYLRALPIHNLTYTAGANGSIDGATSRSQTVNQGANGATVTAMPATLYHFVRWSDGSTANPRTDRNVVADISVTATFSNQWTLIYSAGPSGSVSGATSQTVTQGANGTQVTAVPATGYHFVQWSDGVLTAARTDLDVTGDITVTATFAINRYTLNYTAGTHGSITGATSQTLNYGGNATQVTAVPATGYHFVQWSDGVLTAVRTDLNVTSDITVTASFAINLYSLTYTAGPNGSLDGVTSQTVAYGQSGTAVLAVATPGWYFGSWSDGSMANPRTDTNVTANINVTAQFLPPTEIRTLAELQAVATGNLGAIYTLMNDIDASPTAAWPEGFLPIGASYASFHGVFDGNGHKIVGLTVNQPGSDNVGLFGYVGAGGVVKDLSLERGTVSGCFCTGGLVGCNAGGAITSCTVGCAVTAVGNWTLNCVGGLVGYSSGGAIASCTTTGTVTATVTGGSASCYYVGGLVGRNSAGPIANSKAASVVTASSAAMDWDGYAYTVYVGGLVGCIDLDGTVTGCDGAGAVTATSTDMGHDGDSCTYSVGGLVGCSEAGGTITDSDAAGAVTAASTATGVSGYSYTDHIGGLVGYDTGGTVTGCDAAGAVMATSTATGYWGYSFTDYIGGLIGSNSASTIADCSVAGAATAVSTSIDGYSYSDYVGGLIGDSSASAIENCNIAGAVTATSMCGDHAGDSNTTYVGGLVGNNSDGTITDCLAAGAVTVMSMNPDENSVIAYVGGLVGRNLRSTITGSIAAVALVTTSTCNFAQSSTTNYVGGLIGGNSDSPIIDCHAEGEVGATTVNTYVSGSASSGSVGGLVGLNSSSPITSCSATGAVAGAVTGRAHQSRVVDVGGLVGGNGTTSTITASHATGAVTAACTVTNTSMQLYLNVGPVGGLVGTNNSAITDCYAAGPVTGLAAGLDTTMFDTPTLYTDGVGGLVGSNYSHGGIASSYATGAVTAMTVGMSMWGDLDARFVGGLVGLDHGSSITNCYATGAVAGTAAATGHSLDVGGLVGCCESTCTITTCYAAGPVTGISNVGGLVGLSNAIGTVAACYWDVEATGQATSDGGTGETTAQMKQQATFVGWDFAAVWDIAAPINNGYPFLRVHGSSAAGPNKPTAPSPADGAVGQAVDVVLGWQDGGGAVSYDVYFGTANPPVTRVSTAQTGTTYVPPVSLTQGTTYFWRIDATNPTRTTTGDVWSFATVPTTVLPPNKATVPSPADGATGQPVAVGLGWQNGGGATSYNVYLDTANPPVTRVATAQTGTTYAPPASLGLGTTYFWRVDAKNAAGTTPGDVWSFSTTAAPITPVLAVTPPEANVSAARDLAPFTVANTGTGTIQWTAEVTEGGDWLAIVSGGSGSGGGTIGATVAANEGAGRTGTITVTATSADGAVANSPRTVTVTQAPPGHFVRQSVRSTHSEKWNAKDARVVGKDAYSFTAKMQLPAGALASLTNATTLTLVLGDDVTSGAACAVVERALAAATKSTLAGHPTAKKPKDPTRGGSVSFVELQPNSTTKARVVTIKWTKTGLLTATVLGTPPPATWDPANHAQHRVVENVADLCDAVKWPAGAAAGVAVPALVEITGVFADADTVACAGKKSVKPSDGGDLVGWSVSGK